MRYTYNFPTTIRFGAGVIDELADHLKANNIAKPLLVTDSIVVQLDFFKKIKKDLAAKNIHADVFYDMHKNPVKSDVLRGTDIFRNTNCDCAIGIGGGVAMDVARAIVLKANHYEDLFYYDDLIGGDKYVTNEVPYFITIPTTSGTGSEVGRSAIIGDEITLPSPTGEGPVRRTPDSFGGVRSHQKKILFSPKLLAKIAFCDPMLTMDLPPFVTAATGMDALTHNLEAFLAKMYHPICEGIALEGISLITKSIERAVNKPDTDSRSMMMLGSTMGAIAFQKGLGVVHSLAHPLSSLLDTHHGLANAVNLPYGMSFNIEGCEEKFRRIAKTIGLEKENGQTVVDYLFQLNKNIGLPAKLSGIGVKKEHIETLSDLAFADFCHPNNPKPVTKEDFKKLYLEAL